MDKRQRTPPRYLGPYDFFPLIPCYICPRNVAVRPSDGKPRITADFGGPRNRDAFGALFHERQPASRPGPLSLNANLYQHHGIETAVVIELPRSATYYQPHGSSRNNVSARRNLLPAC